MTTTLSLADGVSGETDLAITAAPGAPNNWCDVTFETASDCISALSQVVSGTLSNMFISFLQYSDSDRTSLINSITYGNITNNWGFNGGWDGYGTKFGEQSKYWRVELANTSTTVSCEVVLILFGAALS